MERMKWATVVRVESPDNYVNVIARSVREYFVGYPFYRFIVSHSIVKSYQGGGSNRNDGLYQVVSILFLGTLAIGIFFC